MSAIAKLTKYNITLEQAYTWIVTNVSSPALIFNTCKSAGLTNSDLVEILMPHMPVVTADGVRAFFNANGLLASDLDVTSTDITTTTTNPQSITSLDWLYAFKGTILVDSESRGCITNTVYDITKIHAMEIFQNEFIAMQQKKDLMKIFYSDLQKGMSQLNASNDVFSSSAYQQYIDKSVSDTIIQIADQQKIMNRMDEILSDYMDTACNFTANKDGTITARTMEHGTLVSTFNPELVYQFYDAQVAVMKTVASMAPSSILELNRDVYATWLNNSQYKAILQAATYDLVNEKAMIGPTTLVDTYTQELANIDVVGVKTPLNLTLQTMGYH